MVNENSSYQPLLEIFAIEAQEHLQAIHHHLAALEKSADPEQDEPVLAILYRAAHTLKGAAAAAGLEEIQRLSHQLEAIFGQWRSGKLQREAESFELVYRTVAAIDRVAHSRCNQEEPDVNVGELYQRLTALSRTSLVPRYRSRHSPGAAAKPQPADPENPATI